MFCSKCGSPLEIGSKFCSKCGTAQVVNPQPVKESPVVNVQPVKESPVVHKNYAKTFIIISAVVSILFGLVIFAIISALSSLSSLFITGTNSNKEKAIELIEAKYDEDFEFVDFGFNNIGSDNYLVYFKTTDGTDIMFRAYIDKEGNGLEDSYSTNVVGHELTVSLNEELSNLDVDYFAFVYTGDDLSDGYGKDTTYSNFSVKNPDGYYYPRVYLKAGAATPENLDKIYSAFEELALKYSGIECAIMVFETKDNATYNEVIEYYETKKYSSLDSNLREILKDSKLVKPNDEYDGFLIEDGFNVTREEFVNAPLSVYDGW